VTRPQCSFDHEQDPLLDADLASKAIALFFEVVPHGDVCLSCRQFLLHQHFSTLQFRNGFLLDACQHFLLGLLWHVWFRLLQGQVFCLVDGLGDVGGGQFIDVRETWLHGSRMHREILCNLCDFIIQLGFTAFK